MSWNKQKMITEACYIAIAMLAGWLVLVLLQLLRWTDIIGINIGLGSQINRLTWAGDMKAIVIQHIEIIGYSASSLLLIALSFNLMVNCIRGIKSKKVFSRKSVGILWGITFASFFFEFFSSNTAILFGCREISFGSNLIVTPLMFLVFTLLYDAATSVSEENELTI